MMRSLVSRLALMLTGIFVVIGALLVGMSLHMPQVREVIALGADLLAAGIAFALLAALLVFSQLTRRLRLLARQIEAFRDSRFDCANRVAWVRADGDEIDRLGQAFNEMCDRICEQIAELKRHDVQRRELLANVSHDLRTPMTLMQGYLETMLLRHGQMSRAEERDCLQIANRHAERLGHLVADLFELAKLEGPGSDLSHEVFALAELAQDVAQKFALGASAQGVSVQARLGDEVGLVKADIGLIERALENLVENALRHTPQGGNVVIEVDREAGRARVSVSDTGCGIPRESLPHVFDRYFQASRVESAGPGGAPPASAVDAPSARHHAGLGLAITRRIVALHGGEIHVASTLGVGTMFSFDLPLAE